MKVSLETSAWAIVSGVMATRIAMSDAYRTRALTASSNVAEGTEEIAEAVELAVMVSR